MQGLGVSKQVAIEVSAPEQVVDYRSRVEAARVDAQAAQRVAGV